MATIEKATTNEAAVRAELLDASDEVIEDAVKYANPMALRGILFQLTGDPEVKDIEVTRIMAGFAEAIVPAREDDVAMLQRKAADFLKSYRDSGAGPIDVGPRDRLPTSLCLAGGEPIPDENIGLYLEELALDHSVRSLKWQSPPDPEQLKDFSVTIIGAGMGGLNAAIQLRQAGIPYTVVEKNSGVGGTWYENRYPGARVDTPSRSYTHLFGVDFGYPNPFCDWTENVKYFDWVADSHGIRDEIQFNTEVSSLNWDEDTGLWDIRMKGPDGERVHHSRAVITAVGFLNRPNLPEIEGAEEFQGPTWHTSRWPEEMDLTGKRVAVIGTGATGYQMIPDLALQAGHVTAFQRTAQWVFPIPGYRSPFPPQVNWLDRNLPFHTNFMRGGMGTGSWFVDMTTNDTEFDDPYACSESNKRARDACIEFLESKLDSPNLVATMTPPHPVWSARAIMVDPEYSILDAVQRDNVKLVTDGIKRINRTGIECEDGTQHDVDVIVYATGFHATEYLFPMSITGRNGVKLEEMWADGGARAYLGAMVPGFPNFWSLYGPNTNGALNVVTFHELVTFYAMQCMERLILNGERAIDVKEDAYWRYNRHIDEQNNRKVWSDPRARNYYWSKHGRSVVQNPLSGPEMWRMLREPDFEGLEVS
jgi:4-hydroxyacetophenone monooxygenase